MQLSLSNIGIQNGEEEAAYALLQKYGFAGLEVAPSRLVGEYPYEKIDAAQKEAQRLAAQYGLCVPSMQSIWYGRTESIFDAEGAKALQAYTEKTVRFAAAVGCPSLVFGCPRNRSIPQGKTQADALPFFTHIAAQAAANGTAVALEANPPIYNTNFINTTREAFAFAKQVPHLRVNYDFGTCLVNEESLNVLAENLPLVSHVHISEPNLVLIEHRPLHKELAQVLRAGGYAHFVSVEMKAQPPEALERTLAYVREVFA